MSRSMRILSLMLIAALFCVGCKQETSGIAESQQWTSWPQLTYGTMEYEKLKVEPWYSGRAEATSRNLMAETKDGYYLGTDEIIRFADKTDINTWLPVCSKPNCSHNPLGNCNAVNSSWTITIKNGRIYFYEMTSHYPELTFSDSEFPGFALYSRALDGSDIRLEYVNEEMIPSSGGGEMFSFFTSEHWIYCIAKLNPDGTYTLQCHRITENGGELLASDIVPVYPAKPMYSFHRLSSNIYGEPTFNHYLLGDTPYAECRYVDGELTFTDLTGYYDDGRFLTGNTLRMFRRNDGYYDVNLKTGEEVRIGDTYLKDGDSRILLPNCIIESTLFQSVSNLVQDGEHHAMALFDGENWREVQLPKELAEPGYNKYLMQPMVSSDSIFFVYRERIAVHLYRIPIQNGDLALEYCGRIK